VSAGHALLGWQILFVVSVLAPVALPLSLSLVMRGRSRRFRTVPMLVQVAAWLLVDAVVWGSVGESSLALTFSALILSWAAPLACVATVVFWLSTLREHNPTVSYSTPVQ
jgi:hypothetical protein